MAAVEHPRDRGRAFLELFAMSGIAIAEPVLTAFRDGADIFVLRRASPFEIVAWAVLVTVLPAFALWAVEQIVARLAPDKLDLAHGSFIGLLAGIFALRVVHEIGQPPRAVALFVVVVAAALLAAAVARYDGARSALRLLAVLPVALLGLFLFTEPVSTLVFDDDGSGVGPVPVGDPDPVVMVVLDELPTASLLDDDDRISADQFPAFARLAADATWYRNNSSVSPSTPTAVPAVLTGRYPTSTEELPVVEEHPDNLFTLLEGAYVEHVAEGATALCPLRLCAGDGIADQPSLIALADDAVDLLGDKLSPTPEGRQGEFVVRQSDPGAPSTFEDFLDGVDAVPEGARPRLEFLHLLYPHQPWFHLPDGADYEAPFVAKGLTTTYEWESTATADAGRQRHLLQARHADALLGRLLDRLDDLDRYDESLIVVTADHGVAFEPDEPIRGLSAGNAAEVMWTPLLVKEPGQTAGAIDERPVQTIDILPTIADHLAIDLPFEVDGASALGDELSTGTDDERHFTEWGLNQRLPPPGEVLIPVDGAAGYRDLLALPAPGVGDDPALRFYRFGRWGPMVGRPVDEFARGPSSEVAVRVTGLPRFDAVDPDAATLPAYVMGSSPLGVQADLAVSVNGVIGGWGTTVDTRETRFDEWWTMIPPSLLREGANEIGVWEVVDDPGAPGEPTLRPVVVLG